MATAKKKPGPKPSYRRGMMPLRCWLPPETLHALHIVTVKRRQRLAVLLADIINAACTEELAAVRKRATGEYHRLMRQYAHAANRRRK